MRYREAANASMKILTHTHTLIDGWERNRKFWACGSVPASVDLIWATLYDKKLAEEL